MLLALSIVGCNESAIINPDIQLNADKEAIRQFLEDNDITDYVEHSSGVFYRFIKEGTGTKPELYHYVRVKYKGSLMDEDRTVFDESPTTDPPYSTFILSGVIAGWQIGLKLMPEGSKAVLYIPSSLAYGKVSSANIPANSNLEFEVELLDVIE